jgi:hypothetical protein
MPDRTYSLSFKANQALFNFIHKQSSDAQYYLSLFTNDHDQSGLVQFHLSMIKAKIGPVPFHSLHLQLVVISISLDYWCQLLHFGMACIVTEISWSAFTLVSLAKNPSIFKYLQLKASTGWNKHQIKPNQVWSGLFSFIHKQSSPIKSSLYSFKIDQYQSRNIKPFNFHSRPITSC